MSNRFYHNCSFKIFLVIPQLKTFGNQLNTIREYEYLLELTFKASPEKTKEIVTDTIQNNTILKDMEARFKEISEQMGNALPF